eukprot:11705247-Alexandrium_andersonii.AAC.1
MEPPGKPCAMQRDVDRTEPIDAAEDNGEASRPNRAPPCGRWGIRVAEPVGPRPKLRKRGPAVDVREEMRRT